MPDGRRRVDEDNTAAGGHEHGLVDRVGHPVQVAADIADEVAVRVERRPEGARWYRRVTGKPAWCRCPGGATQRTAANQGSGGGYRGGCSRSREEAAAARGITLGP